MAEEPAGIWRRIKADPGHGPELVAQAAMAHYPPAARAWADRLRRTYPFATPDGLARLAARDHIRLARAAGAATVLGGPLGPLTGTAAVLAVQGRLVAHIAAAYEVEPRAADLLVLTGVHPSVEAAEAALAAAEKPGAPTTLWRAGVPLLRMLGGWTVLRAAARVLPGAAIVLGATAGARRMEALAADATRYYRRRPSRSLNRA